MNILRLTLHLDLVKHLYSLKFGFPTTGTQDMLSAQYLHRAGEHGVQGQGG